MARQGSQGQSLLEHGNDWAGRAIAAETLVRSLEQELEDPRTIYLSARRDAREEFVAHEAELEETIFLLGDAYDSLINLIVLHEPILRAYYDERDLELPKEKFEAAMHELHQALVIRTLHTMDDVRDALGVDAGE